MEKLEKVIAGMEACNGVGEDCNSCPYAGEGLKCSDVFWADILAVLKEYAAALEAAAARKVDGDLISRSELLGTESLLMTDIVANDPVARFVLDQVLHDIKAAPAVEARPVVHAHWIRTDLGMKCSNPRCRCRSAFWDSDLKSPFCPWCGAHMDEEEPHGDTPV